MEEEEEAALSSDEEEIKLGGKLNWVGLQNVCYVTC